MRVVAKYCDEYVCLCVCLSVCLSTTISPEPRRQSLPNFLCMFPMSVARSSDMLTIGRIVYRQEGDDGSAQCGRSVMYDCLVCTVIILNIL